MVSVTIRIEATSTEPYMRYHGKSVDQALASNFWDTQEEKQIGVAGKSFTHTQTVELAGGSHYVIYGNSAATTYVWPSKIFINGVLKAQGNVNRGAFLRADFTVEAAPPTELPEFRFDSWNPGALDYREIFIVGSAWPDLVRTVDVGEDVYAHYVVKNIGSLAGKATITVKDLDTGAVITTWSSPELAPNERFKTSSPGAYIGKMPARDWNLEFKVEP